MLQVKLLTNVQVPTLGTPGSAGYDLYLPCETIQEPGLNPVKLGISVAIPQEHYGQIHDRSSIAKKNITTSAGVIDSDYRGEVIILLTNHNSYPITFDKGDRIAQLIIHSIITPSIQVVETLDQTQRTGGFGSTGR
jgi:dUTP pyrophosphatase